MREFLRQFFHKISLNHAIVITGIASWRSWKSSSQIPQNILNGVLFQKTEIFLTIDVIKAWQIGVEPSTSDSFTCFFSSFFAFFVSFDIQVITQKVTIFYSAKFFNLLFVYMWASDLNFLLSLVGPTGSADLPVFYWVEFISPTERNQTSARFALVFCIWFYWPRYTKR